MTDPEVRRERITSLRIRYDYAVEQYAQIKSEIRSIINELAELGEEP
jgi:hypothetical protein